MLTLPSLAHVQEGGVMAVATASGMAAQVRPGPPSPRVEPHRSHPLRLQFSAIITLARVGDNIISTTNLYGAAGFSCLSLTPRVDPDLSLQPPDPLYTYLTLSEPPPPPCVRLSCGSLSLYPSLSHPSLSLSL